MVAAMMRELVIFLLMYGVILAGHHVHTRYAAWAKLRRRKRIVGGWIRRHVVAVCIATVAHPVTHATFKDYALHLVVDSGYAFLHAPH